MAWLHFGRYRSDVECVCRPKTVLPLVGRGDAFCAGLARSSRSWACPGWASCIGRAHSRPHF